MLDFKLKTTVILHLYSSEFFNAKTGFEDLKCSFRTLDELHSYIVEYVNKLYLDDKITIGNVHETGRDTIISKDKVMEALKDFEDILVDVIYVKNKEIKIEPVSECKQMYFDIVSREMRKNELIGILEKVILDSINYDRLSFINTCADDSTSDVSGYVVYSTSYERCYLGSYNLFIISEYNSNSLRNDIKCKFDELYESNSDNESMSAGFTCLYYNQCTRVYVIHKTGTEDFTIHKIPYREEGYNVLPNLHAKSYISTEECADIFLGRFYLDN